VDVKEREPGDGLQQAEPRTSPGGQECSHLYSDSDSPLDINRAGCNWCHHKMNPLQKNKITIPRILHNVN